MPTIAGYSKITQLPDGTLPLGGTELMEMVQAGVSVKMPVTAFPSTQAGLIVIADTPSLSNSRIITAGLGVTIQDNGPRGTLVINALGGVNFHAPTALVGLAPITGVAPTVMASDSAPALDQSIAPTWTGAHVWTNAAGIKVSNTQPITELLESDAAANQRRWQLRAQGEQLLISALSDDGLTTGNIIIVDRTNEVIDNINLTATIVQVNGQNVRDAAILTSGLVGTARLGSGTADATTFLRGDQTWQLATSIFAGFANPTANVGLAAVNGAATTAMRSDAAPALSQGIAPTWTGQHTWSLNLLGPNGALTTPTFSFSGDSNTGMYDVGADNLGFQSGGVLRLNISTTQIVSTLVSVGPNGTAPLPAYSFSGDPNTGMYNVGADDLGFATNGVLRLDISTTQIVSTLVSVGPNGTALLPAYSFSGDPNTGMYNFGADDLGFATNGTVRMHVTSTGVLTVGDTTNAGAITLNTPAATDPIFTLNRNSGTVGAGIGRISWNALNTTPASKQYSLLQGEISVATAAAEQGRVVIHNLVAGADTTVFSLDGNQAQFRDGTNLLPSITFLSDPDSGMYRVAANAVEMASGGNRIIQFSATSVIPLVNVYQNIDGALATVAYGWDVDRGTGLYRRGAGQLGISCGGVASVAFNGVTTTGASTPGALSANKPGANNSVIAWCPVITTAGAQGWIPIWGN